MHIKMFSMLASVIMAVAYVQGDAVSFITPCKAEDSKCLKENVAIGLKVLGKGIPELGVKPFDPMILKTVNASRPGLKLIATDVTVVGVQDCVPKKVSRDVEKGKMFFKLQCTGTLDGQYEMDGQILILPIRGKGPVHAVLRKLVLNIELDMGEKDGKDGKKHWDIKKWTHSFDLKDKADLVFENLFDGNEILGSVFFNNLTDIAFTTFGVIVINEGRAARELISSSGREVALEIGPPVVKALVAELISSVRNFFDNVPIEQLTLDV